MKFGLIFFSSDEGFDPTLKYASVLEHARFVDRRGFEAVWVPERHFTAEGQLFPNPAVLHAAIAQATERIRLRAGSVVLPLHHPIRVAEEWSMVDNLSGGRVELSFASGWHPTDFAFFPDRFADRRGEMQRAIDIVRRLWRGETVEVTTGTGSTAEVTTYPRPVQPELRYWLTAAGNPATFAAAGEQGADVLTHLFNQGSGELAAKIDAYRRARAGHGHDPEAGRVAVMLHTFVAGDPDVVREQAHGPFREYVRSAGHLLSAVAESRGQRVDVDRLSAHEQEEYLGFVVDRLVEDRRVLFGTPESLVGLVEELAGLGVDEIACQMDFGLDPRVSLDSLPHLDRLRELCAGMAAPARRRAASAGDVSQASPADGLAADGVAADVGPALLEALRARIDVAAEPATVLAALAASGIAAVEGAPSVLDLWRGDDEILARIDAGSGAAPHVLLEAGCDLLSVAASDHPGAAAWSATGFEAMRQRGDLRGELWLHGRLGLDRPRASADLSWFDLEGVERLAVDGLRLARREVAASAAAPAEAGLRDELRRMETEEARRRLREFLTDCLARVLKMPAERVDPEQPLNQMGLDSLVAIELKNRVEASLGLSVPVVGLLRGASLARLAGDLAGQIDVREAPASPPRPEPTAASSQEGALLPLSVGQQGLWAQQQIDPGSPVFNVMVAWTVRSPLDVGSFERSWRALAQRHPQLRSTYHVEGGEPRQLIAADQPLPLRYHAAEEWSDDELRKALHEAAHRPFDLEAGPIYRVELYRRADDHHLLLLTAHHLVIDLGSMTNLFADLGRSYSWLRRGEVPDLPPLAGTYQDYVAWQREMLGGTEGERLWRYWHRQLTGAELGLDLSIARPVHGEPDPTAGVVGFLLDAETSLRLRGLARTASATLFTVLLSAYLVLLHRHGGRTDLSVSCPSASRLLPEMGELVGYFVNLLVLRTDLSRNPTFLELVERSQGVVLDALEHDGFPFPLLIERLGKAAGAPVIPALPSFSLHSSTRQRFDRGVEAAEGLDAGILAPAGAPVRFEAGGLTFDSYPLRPRTTRHPLVLQMLDAGDRLSGSFQYQGARFSAADVQRMARRFETLLAAVAERPERRLAELVAALDDRGGDDEAARDQRRRLEAVRLRGASRRQRLPRAPRRTVT